MHAEHATKVFAHTQHAEKIGNFRKVYLRSLSMRKIFFSHAELVLKINLRRMLSLRQNILAHTPACAWKMKWWISSSKFNNFCIIPQVAYTVIWFLAVKNEKSKFSRFCSMLFTVPSTSGFYKNHILLWLLKSIQKNPDKNFCQKILQFMARSLD